ncbi:MAG: hypothetical protein JWR52_2286 [Marmoricola sp.]|nr:hypothetical protein [Marmoricola sp.]
MSGIEDPDTPPEVPEEFAAAYRDAYRRALEQAPEADAGPDGGSSLLDELTTPVTMPVRAQRADDAQPRWRLPALIAAAALLVIAGAFGIGRLVSSGGSPASGPGAGSTSPVGPSNSPSPSSRRTPKPGQVVQGSRPVDTADPATPVAISGVVTGCTAKPAVDSAGHPVRYVAANTYDGRIDTAWRCDGTAIGTKLVIRIPAGTQVDEVGLIPGYAKTDPTSGIDRYAENNRITRVRWTLADGVVVEQTLDPNPADRSMQLIRTPRTTTGTITLEILAVARGPRNTTDISEIAVGAAVS